MILLEPGNRILAEVVRPQIFLDVKGGEKREPLDVRLCDFDDVAYRVIVDAKAKNNMQVSMQLPCYREIKDFGGQTAFEKSFKDIAVEPLQTFDLSVEVDFNTLAEDEKVKDALVRRIRLFKPLVVGGVFNHFYDALRAGKEETLKPFKFDLRRDTTIFFIPGKQRVVTVFSLDFQEKTDQAIARVFMQEFVDARKTLGYAPPVTFGPVPPSELKEWGLTEAKPGHLGYVSFAILPAHVSTEAKQTQIVEILQTFRTYIQYHLKCSKSYFHARMRFRCVELLKVLNRARVTSEDKAKPKKTFAGKTFTRA